MDAKAGTNVISNDVSPGLERFRAEVLHGLRKPQKELPSKYLYDEEGSRLFELICTLDEYYIPRTEAAIMASSAGFRVKRVWTDQQNWFSVQYLENSLHER